MLRKNSMAGLFLELANPDSDGFSREVHVSEFKNQYSRLQMGNGGSWCRDDGRLAQKYKVIRYKEGGIGNKIVYIKLDGLNPNPISKPIPLFIRKSLKGKKCVVLHNRSSIEIDHKIGWRDDPKLSDISQLKISDFQPLSKAANDAKRQHCIRCQDSNRRFDAKKLGYRVSQIEGGEDYQGTCVGCYWYDPYAFNQEVSKDFQKKV